MKKNKKGFSLAEVLIALTIAAIIATAGFTIARRGIEKAYDRYIYSAYYAISTVLSNTVDGRGLSLNNCTNDAGNPGVFGGNNPTCTVSTTIIESLNGRHIGGNGANNNILDFDTPNGTNYRIQSINNVNAPARPDDPDHPSRSYLVRMKVPAAKTRNANSKTICAVYIENFSWNEQNTPENPRIYENILIPQADTIQGCHNNINNTIFMNGTENDPNSILDRKDLLAFYLEDGIRGRNTINENNERVYNQRIFRSAREIMCIKQIIAGAAHGRRNLPERIECTNYNPALQEFERRPGSNAFIQLADPRRI